ncbi:MAG: hypothetical protein FWC67_00535 [Defluviitaleaceae bacterium]|nr:hypothetical protein [Defluviitaleaceae bacterium]
MNKHFKQSVAGVIAGIAQLGTGLWLTFFVGTNMLSWALIVFGGILFLSSFFAVISNRQVKRNAKGTQEFKNIMNDEREAVINDKARAFTNDFFSWLVWAAIIALAIIQVELWIPLVLVGMQLVRMIVLITASLWIRKNI